MEAILLAAGSGSRMEMDIPKQFFRIKGKPLFIYSLEIFNKCNEIENIIITCKKDHIEEYEFYIDKYNIKKSKCVEGGITRQESVNIALSHINSSKVLIHEAARPLIDLEFLNYIIKNDMDCDAVVPTVPVKFTVAIGDNFMEAELNRSRLHNIQLPQMFNTNILKKSHDLAIKDKYRVTEDSMLIFHYGNKVKFIKGRESNIKVTTQLDLEMVERLLKMD